MIANRNYETMLRGTKRTPIESPIALIDAVSDGHFDLDAENDPGVSRRHCLDRGSCFCRISSQSVEQMEQTVANEQGEPPRR